MTYQESEVVEPTVLGGTTNTIKKIYLGTTEIIRVYFGSSLLLGEKPQ